MLLSFREKLQLKELRNLRLLNVVTSVIVTILGFIFEFAYHDGIILTTGLICSMIFTSNYFLSYYSPYYRQNFTNITYLTITILHFWAVYIAYVRNFEIDILLPVSISTFTFSLIFNRFYKSLFFIFSITSFLMVMMLLKNQWQAEFTIALVALYSGAFLSQEILKRKSEFYTEIQSQEKKYITLVENMNDGLVYLNQNLEINFVNDKFCNISGYSKEEVMKKNIAQVSLPGSDASLIETIRERGFVRSEIVIRRKNGDSRWVQIAASPHIDEEKFVGTLIVYTDITDLKKTQEILKKKEEGYKSFIDQSAVGIWRAEFEIPVSVSMSLNEQADLLLNTGIISECNDAMAKMYGFSSSIELIGRRIRDFYFIEKDNPSTAPRELMKKFIMNDYRIINSESKEKDKYGNLRYILNNNIGIVEDGQLVRIWGVQSDITERKKTEKELIESNQELDTFFYKASHDLKGPLTSVLGILNLARLEFQDKHIDKYFGMIETSVRRLDRTLMDLVELARTRKGAAKTATINLKSFLNDILQSLNNVPDFNKIKFEINADPATKIVCDKVLLLSVFQNLIHNAINYCNHQDPQIIISIRENGEGITFEITDNGKGIPESIRDRVFEMFYRGHPDSMGSGLGLYIVKNALEKMNGSITFESTSGKGTTFTVFVPDKSEVFA